MIVGVLILCVIIAISTLIYRIWSKDTVNYREILNLPKVNQEQDLKVDELITEQEEIKKEMEEYDETYDIIPSAAMNTKN